MSAASNARNQIRSVVQYGNMTQSYKLVLARTLLELADEGIEQVTLLELARSYGGHLCRHMRKVSTQGTMRSVVLDACLQRIDGVISEDELAETIAVSGFGDVLPRFPKVPGQAPADLYERTRVSGKPGLVLRPSLLELGTTGEVHAATEEVEARWNLVEHSWHSRRLRQDNRVRFDPDPQVLIPVLLGDRRPIASFRPALNSYQRDRCFYCGNPISLWDPAIPSHVDHFYPFVAMGRYTNVSLDEVWNLVLTCPPCNLSKGSRLAAERFVSALFRRNEALIRANHPLRETVVSRTGSTSAARRRFLIDLHRSQFEGQNGPVPWEP